MFKERLFWDIGIRPFLNSTADNKGERGGKKKYFYSFEYYPMKFTGKYELHVILHRYLGYLLIFLISLLEALNTLFQKFRHFGWTILLLYTLFDNTIGY